MCTKPGYTNRLLSHSNKVNALPLFSNLIALFLLCYATLSITYTHTTISIHHLFSSLPIRPTAFPFSKIQLER